MVRCICEGDGEQLFSTATRPGSSNILGINMANAFKQKQEQAKLDRLLADCARMVESGASGRLLAVEAYAKGAGVTNQVAERILADRRAVRQMDCRTMFQQR